MQNKTSTMTFHEPAVQPPTGADYLKWNNKAGFSLHHSLNNMLKQWDNGNPGWPVEIGLPYQMSEYKLTEKQLLEAIRSDRRLTERFKGYPESGFV